VLQRTDPFHGLPRGGFRVLYADPPWRFKAWSHRGEGKGATQHYPCMSLEEICALPVAELAADDAALFLWVVQPMLPEAERVIKAWGFTFKTVAFVWIKMPPSWTPESPRHEPRLGLGYHTRSGAEQCWLAVRGRGYRRQAQGVPQVLHAPIRRHSQKPDEIATRIERLVGDVPRVELFARGRRDGWRRWGNEIDKFDGAPRRAGNQNHRAKSAPSRREGLTRFLSDRIPRIAEKRGPCP
jgi:N6-adenosine-specific RNA methylase IME4